MREFKTGATRDTAEGKPQFAGYLSPLVIHAFGEYMLEHQTQADGQRRAADNWQKGIPLEAYMDSMWRHFQDVWLHLRGYDFLARETRMDALMGLLFNVQGIAHETLKADLEAEGWLEANPLQKAKVSEPPHGGGVPRS